jgi:hypothetical protein
MNMHLVRRSLLLLPLLLACVGLAACQDRRDPVKPVVPASAAPR